jgi:hypothetical protein
VDGYRGLGDRRDAAKQITIGEWRIDWKMIEGYDKKKERKELGGRGGEKLRAEGHG